MNAFSKLTVALALVAMMGCATQVTVTPTHRENMAAQSKVLAIAARDLDHIVRQHLAEVAATGAVVTCSLTRFVQGKRIDGMLYRMSGWVPPPAPGRKAKPTA